MFIERRLKHTGFLQKASNTASPDMFGNRQTIITTTRIPCLAYQDSITAVGYPVQVADQDWFVLLPHTATVSEGDFIRGITDVNSVSVTSGGKVKSVTKYNHPDRGLESILVRLDLN
jgi:hypothetical protein